MQGCVTCIALHNLTNAHTTQKTAHNTHTRTHTHMHTHTHAYTRTCWVTVIALPAGSLCISRRVRSAPDALTTAVETWPAATLDGEATAAMSQPCTTNAPSLNNHIHTHACTHTVTYRLRACMSDSTHHKQTHTHTRKTLNTHVTERFCPPPPAHTQQVAASSY